MRYGIILAAMIALSPAAHATTLNKCTDAKGKVTYSNLPCSNARETQILKIDPPPVPTSQPALQPAPPAAHSPAAAPTAPQLDNRSTAGTTAARPASRQCDALTDKLGRLMDRMDETRRKGHTPAQMDAWNREAQDIEREKAEAGCF